MFYGQGAGGAPTASAVLGDLVAVARNRVSGGRGPRESAYAEPAGAADGRRCPRATTSAWTWPTAPACWPPIAGEFAQHGVSIAAVRQTGGGAGRRRRAARWSSSRTPRPDAALAATVRRR